MKSPNALVDMVLAKKYEKGRAFHFQNTPHHVLSLGQCLSITKASSKMTDG